MVVLLVYVDDQMVIGSSVDIIEQLKDLLKSTFKMKDLGRLRLFLGIDIARNNDRISLNQHSYALDLISESGLAGSKSIKTPMEANVKLTSADYDKLFEHSQGDEILHDITSYKRLIGKFLYLIVTRPDISFSV